MTDLSYRALLEKEIRFIKPIWKTIQDKANAIYSNQKETGIVRTFCCNYTRLEQIYNQENVSRLITV